MQKHHRFLLASGAVMLSVSLACMTSAFAAKPVELKFQSAKALQAFTVSANTANAINLKYLNTSTDMQHQTHVRMQETFSGYPVWGADVIIHTSQTDNTSLNGLMANPNATVNGVLYQDLNKDLNEKPSDAQANKALDQAINLYFKNKSGNQSVREKKSELMVFIDTKNKAHWAYLVSFEVQPEKGMYERPTAIIDASTLHVYHEWNDVKKLDEVSGGGFGGNIKMGKLSYDGLTGNLAKLSMQRDADANMCYLSNSNVTVRDYNKRGPDGLNKIMDFSCAAVDTAHDNIYWNADQDAVNDGYSPSNDALYAGKVIFGMYNDWYGVPPLVQEGKPMMLNMIVHMYDDNAYWDGRAMTFGDGITMFYPLTSLGVAGHEVSHGFTQQHSNLAYYSQSGGLNEAFSDMAAQAAEFYSTGVNSWQIGPEIFKEDGKALRYMDDPTKDCPSGRTPGNWCSIGHMSQYKEGIDVHFTSGIFNKAYYLIGTSDGWDAKKAFDVMVKANMAYWRSNIDFHIAANCVLKATRDLGYDESAVKKAFNAVGLYGVNIANCV